MRREYKLPELFDMYMGKTPDRNNLEYWENGTHPWISIADMTSNGKLIRNTKEYITDKAIRETGIKPINYNTVIMSFKLSVGKVSKVATKECPAYSNEAIMAFEIPPVPVGSPMILNDYAYYLLQSLDFTNAGNKAVMGKTLNKAILQNTAVKIHVDLDVQSEIITVLDKVTDLIDKRKEQLLKLDELVKARFVELFGDPVCNSKCLSLSPLNDVCTKITDGTHDTPARYNSGYLLITGKNIRSSGIIFDDIEFVSAEDHKIIYNRCNPEYGDVLYTNIGVNYGTACYNNLDYEFSMKNVALLKPNQKLINSYYLWECLNIMRDYILSMNQVGGAQTFMGLATIKKITIPVPPIELQNQFADFVKQTDKSKLEFQKSLEKLELLKKALMKKYFG